jgi:hypothetical protein
MASQNVSLLAGSLCYGMFLRLDGRILLFVCWMRGYMLGRSASTKVDASRYISLIGSREICIPSFQLAGTKMPSFLAPRLADAFLMAWTTHKKVPKLLFIQITVSTSLSPSLLLFAEAACFSCMGYAYKDPHSRYTVPTPTFHLRVMQITKR